MTDQPMIEHPASNETPPCAEPSAAGSVDAVDAVARAVEQAAEECGFSIFSDDAQTIAQAAIAAMPSVEQVRREAYEDAARWIEHEGPSDSIGNRDAANDFRGYANSAIRARGEMGG